MLTQGYVSTKNENGKGAVGTVIGLILVLAFIVVPFSFHTVQTGEIAVVKHLGKAKEIKEAGLHLCLELEDVFAHYEIGNGNRFFKVRALVRKSEKERYGHGSDNLWNANYNRYRNKLVSKSIIFEEEVSEDVLIKEARKRYFKDWMNPDDDTVRAFIAGDYKAIKNHVIELLTNDGYSELVARYIVNHLPDDRAELAHALMSQEGLSMDAKMICIMTGDDD